MSGRNRKASKLRGHPANPPPEGGIEAAYARLATAIVRMAATDYAEALAGMLRAETRAVRKHHIDVKRQAEKFFRSEWYTALCDLDPDALMKGMEGRAVEEALEEAREGLRDALREHDRREGR